MAPRARATHRDALVHAARADRKRIPWSDARMEFGMGNGRRTDGESMCAFERLSRPVPCRAQPWPLAPSPSAVTHAPSLTCAACLFLSASRAYAASRPRRPAEASDLSSSSRSSAPPSSASTRPCSTRQRRCGRCAWRLIVGQVALERRVASAAGEARPRPFDARQRRAEVRVANVAVACT